MKINFYTYCGCAGDLQAMLVGVDPGGHKVHRLYSRTGFLSLLSLRRAKKNILREFEILTGKTPVEEI